MKSLSEHDREELLKMIAEESENEGTGYLLSEIVWEYIERCSTDLGWMGMDEPIGKAIYAALFQETGVVIEDSSNCSELCSGILHSVYGRAMKDCAAMLGIESGTKLEYAVIAFAEQNNYGRDGEVRPAVNNADLPAIVDALANDR